MFGRKSKKKAAEEKAYPEVTAPQDLAASASDSEDSREQGSASTESERPGAKVHRTGDSAVAASDPDEPKSEPENGAEPGAELAESGTAAEVEQSDEVRTEGLKTAGPDSTGPDSGSHTVDVDSPDTNPSDYDAAAVDDIGAKEPTSQAESGTHSDAENSLDQGNDLGRSVDDGSREVIAQALSDDAEEEASIDQADASVTLTGLPAVDRDRDLDQTDGDALVASSLSDAAATHGPDDGLAQGQAELEDGSDDGRGEGEAESTDADQPADAEQPGDTEQPGTAGGDAQEHGPEDARPAPEDAEHDLEDAKSVPEKAPEEAEPDSEDAERLSPDPSSQGSAAQEPTATGLTSATPPAALAAAPAAGRPALLPAATPAALTATASSSDGPATQAEEARQEPFDGVESTIRVRRSIPLAVFSFLVAVALGGIAFLWWRFSTSLQASLWLVLALAELAVGMLMLRHLHFDVRVSRTRISNEGHSPWSLNADQIVDAGVQPGQHPTLWVMPTDDAPDQPNGYAAAALVPKGAKLAPLDESKVAEVEQALADWHLTAASRGQSPVLDLSVTQDAESPVVERDAVAGGSTATAVSGVSGVPEASAEAEEPQSTEEPQDAQGLGGADAPGETDEPRGTGTDASQGTDHPSAKPDSDESVSSQDVPEGEQLGAENGVTAGAKQPASAALDPDTAAWLAGFDDPDESDDDYVPRYARRQAPSDDDQEDDRPLDEQGTLETPDEDVPMSEWTTAPMRALTPEYLAQIKAQLDEKPE